MTVFSQTVMSGLLIGCVYGLIGVGFSISYLTAGILNFAQGDLVGVGAYLMLSLYTAGLSLVASMLISAVIVGVGLALVERLMWRPLYKYGLVFATLSSFGLSILLESGIQLIWGAPPRILPSLLSVNTFQVGGVYVSPQQILGAATSVALCIGIAWMLSRTRPGRGMRVLAADSDVAALVGVNANWLLFTAFFIAGSFAIIASAMIAPAQGLTPNMGATLTVIGFTAAALGGFGSPLGALVGGAVVGIGENLVVVYLSPNYKDVITYALLILVLLLRPQGLLGEKTLRARVV